MSFKSRLFVAHLSPVKRLTTLFLKMVVDPVRNNQGDMRCSSILQKGLVLFLFSTIKYSTFDGYCCFCSTLMSIGAKNEKLWPLTWIKCFMEHLVYHHTTTAGRYIILSLCSTRFKDNNIWISMSL